MTFSPCVSYILIKSLIRFHIAVSGDKNGYSEIVGWKYCLYIPMRTYKILNFDLSFSILIFDFLFHILKQLDGRVAKDEILKPEKRQSSC